VTLDVSQVPVEQILPLRELHRELMQCQIVDDFGEEPKETVR